MNGMGEKHRLRTPAAQRTAAEAALGLCLGFSCFIVLCLIVLLSCRFLFVFLLSFYKHNTCAVLFASIVFAARPASAPLRLSGSRGRL